MAIRNGIIKMLKNIAVLIDADNLGSQKIDWIFDKIDTLGTITTKRIYGDFTKPHLSSWESYILKHAIEKKHQTSYSTGKNSSDIALAIDAMDLLHSHDCDAFCIVSSDSDFIGLALRLRRNNIQVFGFGETKASKEFRQVCSQFFEIPEHQITHIHQVQENTTSVSTKYTANQLKSDTKLLNALRNSIQQCLQNGWANYGTVNAYLLNHYSDLSPQKYGYSKWSDIILQIDLFIGESKKGGLFICLKNNQKTTISNPNKSDATKLKQDTTLINAIRDSIRQHSVNGWAYYGVLNNHLNHTYPKLSPKSYGYPKWRTLIEQIDLFEIKLNNSSLFVREKSNDNFPPITKNKAKIKNPALLDDVLQIINENNLRTDEWVHIGYLGSQLKNKGYNPKNFGFKSFSLLLENIDGILIRKNGSTVHITLTDKSKIKPVTLILSNNSTDNISQQTTSLERTPILEPSNIKQSNQELLNIITQIINGYKDRKDEWVRAAYITVQLKLKNYQAQEFGYPTLLDLLYSLPELVSKTENHILYFTLVDRSKVKIYERTLPIRSEKTSPRNYNMHNFQYPITYSYSDADYIDDCGYPHWD